MEHIIDGVLRFQREVHPNRQALFHHLALGQAPSAMFIGCADSRIVPEMLTQQGPGSLFVVRNAGNIVPPSSTEPGGAMTAILRGAQQLENLPAVARWLHHADAARRAVTDEHAHSPFDEQLNALVHENVLAQLDNLLTHSVVASAIQSTQLRLHGWVYDIASGGVNTYDARRQKFVPIGSDAFANATPRLPAR